MTVIAHELRMLFTNPTKHLVLFVILLTLTSSLQFQLVRIGCSPVADWAHLVSCLRVPNTRLCHMIAFSTAGLPHNPDKPLSKMQKSAHLTNTSRSNNVRLVTLPRSNRSCTCPLGISRASRLRHLPSGLFGNSNGMLFCDRLHMGRHSGRFRSSNYCCMQYCFRYLSKCMCSCTTSSNAIKGEPVYL